MSWRIQINLFATNESAYSTRPLKIHSYRFNSKSIRPKCRSTRSYPYPIIERKSKRSVLVCGQNVCGQLGLSPAIVERQKPQHLKLLNDRNEEQSIEMICAGAMHSCALTSDRRVFSWGCNDDGALARVTDDIDEEYQPSLCPFPEPIHSLCAGDSFTVALTTSGRVYLSGCFRNSSGRLGLLQPNQMVTEPILLPFDQTIKQIVCGADFCLLLTDKGDLYSFGNNEVGQLGRNTPESNLGETINEQIVRQWLRPSLVQAFQGQKVLNVWAGGHGFFALVQGAMRQLYSAGANSYGQLGHRLTPMISSPTPINGILSLINPVKIACGLQHTLLLDSSGHVFGLGRSDDGRLGSLTNDHFQIEQLVELTDIIDIAAGGAVSFVIDMHRQCYSFGMGDTCQTGHGNEDIFRPRKINSKHVEGRMIEEISVGAQHTLFLISIDEHK